MHKVVNTKLPSSPVSAALKMMDSLFSTEELVNGNPSGITKSKDSTRRATVQPMDPERMKYPLDFLEQKWPGCTSDKSIRRKMTQQKCTDAYNDPWIILLRYAVRDNFMHSLNMYLLCIMIIFSPSTSQCLINSPA